MKIITTLGTYSGKLGNLVFAFNKGGAYVRAKGGKTNPQTPKQTIVRERLSQLSKAWSAVLTVAQRFAWKLFADTYSVIDALGQAKNLTGIAMYNKINGILLAGGFSIIQDPPVDLDVSSSLTMAITAAVGGTSDIVLTYSPVLTADEVLYISGVVNISPGITNVKNKRRFLGVSGLAEVSPFTFSLPAEIGNLVVDQKSSLLIQRLDSTKGALSPGVVVEAINT